MSVVIDYFIRSYRKHFRMNEYKIWKFVELLKSSFVRLTDHCETNLLGVARSCDEKYLRK